MIPGRSLALSKWQILDLKNRSLGQGMHPSGRFWPWHLTLLSLTRHRYGCPERKGTCPGQSCPCTEGPDRRLGVQNLLSVPLLTPLQTAATHRLEPGGSACQVTCPSCVTLGKLLDISGLSIISPEIQITTRPTSQGCGVVRSGARGPGEALCFLLMACLLSH